MWKAALFLVVLVVAGHFVVRYVRTNPLDPVIESNEVVVGTNDNDVRLARDGPVEGTYLVTGAESTDWTNEPANAELDVINFAEARDLLRAYPDFRRYGTSGERQFENASSTFSLIAANRIVYGDLRGLVGRVEERVSERGERVCITIGGESLRVTQAVSRDDGFDRIAAYANRKEAMQLIFVNTLRVDDCSALAESR